MAGSPSSLSATARLHSAISRPLQQRCVEISQILDGTSTKELHALLPMLLESMFGFNNQPGWGIDRLTKANYEFHCVRTLLGPHGPVLRLVYQLMADPYIYKYEFSLSCIPFPSMLAIEEGSVPQFYSDKLQLNQLGRPYNMLSLNAFEFFFFHFAYSLVGSHSHRSSSWSNPTDALFPVLLEEYLMFFLPLDGCHALPVMQQGAKSPPTTLSSIHGPSRGTPSGDSTPLSRLSSLLRSGTLPASPSYSQARQAPTTTSSAPDHSEQDMWRSQIFLQILVEFWLNQTSSLSSVDRHAAGHSYSSMQHQHNYQAQSRRVTDPYRCLVYCMPFPRRLITCHFNRVIAGCDSFLPSSDHVRVVRMLVKHLHFFGNSVKPYIISSPYSPSIISPWDQFKKMVLPQLVQKQLYAFLRHTFEKWPLDSSFRLILETWLSFIQPWRYINPGQSNAEIVSESQERVMETKWSTFVVENLLFYTVLLHSFMQRCFKLDLSLPKNAYMLYRVSKVFSTHNLKEMIQEAEGPLFLLTPGSHRSCMVPDLGATYVAPANRHHSNVLPVLALHITELEGQNFQYKPIFCEETERLVQQLLSAVSQAKGVAQVSSQYSPDQSESSFLDWLGCGGTWASRYDGYDEFAGGDGLKRTEAHLEKATSNLCDFFQLKPPVKADRSVTWGGTEPISGKAATLTPDVYDTEDGPKLSPLGRYQMMNGLRKFEVEYKGDPDLQPIRSFESKAMVRILYSITSYFNLWYGPQMSSIYYRPDFLGRVAQHLLHPPSVRDSPVKVSNLSPAIRHQVEEYQSPRLSLRWLASYQNIGYMVVLYLLLYMSLGVGPVGFVFLLLCLGLLSAMVKALFKPVKKKAS